MSKAIDETWDLDGDEILTDAEDGHASTHARGWTSEDDIGPGWVVVDEPANEARTQLMACAPEMARLLLKLEWVSVEGELGHLPEWCESCERWGHQGHADDCRWVATMKRAGLR